MLRVEPVLIGSHAELKVILGAPSAERRRVDLPIPTSARAPEEKSANPPVAELSVQHKDRVTVVEVTPTGPRGVVSDAEVAAVEGLLIL